MLTSCSIRQVGRRYTSFGMDDYGSSLGASTVSGEGRHQWSTFDSMSRADGNNGFASVANRLLLSTFGWMYLVWLLAQHFPLWIEKVVEDGIHRATWLIVSMLLRLSPVFFAFQSKMIGSYKSYGVSKAGGSIMGGFI